MADSEVKVTVIDYVRQSLVLDCPSVGDPAGPTPRPFLSITVVREGGATTTLPDKPMIKTADTKCHHGQATPTNGLFGTKTETCMTCVLSPFRSGTDPIVWASTEAGLLLFLFVIIFIIIFATSGKKQYLKTPPLRDGKFIETTTSCGKVEGKMEDSAYAFRGIPYARPPVNDLRFKYAKPLNQIGYCWNGTLLAHNATPTCMQMLSNGTVIGIEDCLTLDIVTPAVKYDNPLPVIVLIGADSFNGGSPGKMRPSARYARSRDVVFVRPNFRLGVLGFLSHVYYKL
ncbi:hypothetical protein HUJ05_001684 [Dendroctonus ponderosae]|nr:hypothetical protein HUJ05_001684 [Dendroctonus ponderosae]